mmetsp:Transcript_66985/g.190020  ORF Transcript_66985/g.190020 Transcript_66985/m.190020 type:complete len:253 (+) Transcript_66985:717-1475(+)
MISCAAEAARHLASPERPSPTPAGPSGALPAAMLAAAPAGHSGLAGKTKGSDTSGASPSGACSSPALTSASSASNASFWAAWPITPVRSRRRNFSMEGRINFCSLGAPPETFQMLLATRLTAASTSDLIANTKHKRRSRTSFVEQSSVVSRSWPNLLCSRILSATLPSNTVIFSRSVTCLWRSSADSLLRLAQKAPSKASRSSSGQRSPNRCTRATEARCPGSSVWSLSPVMPINMAGKSASICGTKSICIA